MDGNMSDVSVSDDESIMTAKFSVSTISEITVEELREKSLNDVISMYAIGLYHSENLKYVRTVITEKIVAEYKTLENLIENENVIQSIMKLGLRPTWEEEEVEYELLKKRKGKNISADEKIKKQRLKQIKTRLSLRAKRFFKQLLKDVFNYEPPSTVKKSVAVAVNAVANDGNCGIENIYNEFETEAIYNPNFEFHEFKVPMRMVVSAPAGTGMYFFLLLLLCCI